MGPEPFQFFLRIPSQHLGFRPWWPDSPWREQNLISTLSPQVLLSFPSCVFGRSSLYSLWSSSFSPCWLLQKQASHPHTTHHIQSSLLLSWDRIFPKPPTDFLFCLIGKRKCVKCHPKANHCQGILHCHSQLRLILLHPLGMAVGSFPQGHGCPPDVYTAIWWVDVCKVGTQEWGAVVNMRWHPDSPSHPSLDSWVACLWLQVGF